ncbi:MAG: Sensor histidine kinase TmoS [Pseudomonadota bacterium]
MHLDTQTTIFMICFVYLMLHGAIWLALQEYRSFQVKLWCVSGIISGVAVVLLAMRGNIPDGVFFYGAQLLMLLGTLGRTVALRLYLLPAPQGRVARPRISCLLRRECRVLCSLLLFDLLPSKRMGSVGAVQRVLFRVLL